MNYQKGKGEYNIMFLEYFAVSQTDVCLCETLICCYTGVLLIEAAKCYIPKEF